MCSSEALQPLGVHHFSVTVSYSRPSFMVRIAAESDALPFFVREKCLKKLLLKLFSILETSTFNDLTLLKASVKIYFKFSARLYKDYIG